jgi:hypothetical protein
MTGIRVFVFFAALGAALLVGCGSSDPTGGGGTSSGDYSVPTAQPVAADPCGTPSEGCPCTQLGTTIACKAQKLHFGTFVFCAGERTCSAETGLWTACLSTVSVADADGGISNASTAH